MWAARTFRLARPEPVSVETCLYTNTDDTRFVLERHGPVVVCSAYTETPAKGVRRFLSGTPSILAVQPIIDMVALLEEAGMPAVRAKSVLLTEFAVAAAANERSAPRHR